MALAIISAVGLTSFMMIVFGLMNVPDKPLNRFLIYGVVLFYAFIWLITI